MAFTLVAARESKDSATLTNIAWLADPHVRIEGYNLIVPGQLRNIVMAYFLGPNLTQARIVAPSLRDRGLPDIAPLDLGTEPGSPTPLVDYRGRPLALDPNEQLNVQAAEDGVGATVMNAVLLLHDGNMQIPSGNILTIRATAAVTLTPGAWTNGALTLDQNLRVGRYAVVGFRAQAAGLIAARLVFVGYPWRPGCIGYDADGDLENPMFRMGGLGVWGYFDSTIPPSVDYLSVSADTAEEVYLDLIGPLAPGG